MRGARYYLGHTNEVTIHPACISAKKPQLFFCKDHEQGRQPGGLLRFCGTEAPAQHPKTGAMIFDWNSSTTPIGGAAVAL